MIIIVSNFLRKIKKKRKEVAFKNPNISEETNEYSKRCVLFTENNIFRRSSEEH